MREEAMDEIKLPNHVIDKVERRWASRLAAEAAAWHRNRPAHGLPRTVIDRAGRLVPVAFRRSTLTSGADAFTQIA
jgi:hypothetical protein